jgi:hypothetical protein
LVVEIEAAFKTMKDDLQLRPIYHQLEQRVEAHIFPGLLSARHAARYRDHRIVSHRRKANRRRPAERRRSAALDVVAVAPRSAVASCA